jgi:hypothetical protein
MDKVVYILGAGFSRPLGLPISSDFIDKGKDMFFSYPTKYAHFQEVFKRIRELAYIKTTYDSDLENIEEILSILEMSNLLNNKDQEKVDFIQFIIDVIKYYTPIQEKGIDAHLFPNRMIKLGNQISNEFPLISMLSNELYRNYAGFVLGCFNITLESVHMENGYRQISAKGIDKPTTTYSIISLNYDLVLENIAKYISQFIEPERKIVFTRPPENQIEGIPFLSKLHGSIDSGNIIPPTWNKTLASNSYIQPEWVKALDLLKTANHLRFIGYSLPITDAYVRYLFKAGMLTNEHLKSIDVICLDNSNSIRDRYDNFIKLPTSKYHFYNANSIDYIESIYYAKKVEVGHANFIDSFNARN